MPGTAATHSRSSGDSLVSTWAPRVLRHSASLVLHSAETSKAAKHCALPCQLPTCSGSACKTGTCGQVMLSDEASR